LYDARSGLILLAIAPREQSLVGDGTHGRA